MGLPVTLIVAEEKNLVLADRPAQECAKVSWDISLLKITRITERLNAQFRAEAFNLLNHTNLQQPNPVVFTSGPTQGTVANQAALLHQPPAPE